MIPFLNELLTEINDPSFSVDFVNFSNLLF